MKKILSLTNLVRSTLFLTLSLIIFKIGATADSQLEESFLATTTKIKDEQLLRAPREGAQTPVECPASVELDSIRACICTISDRLTEDFSATWTALAAIDCRDTGTCDLTIIERRLDEIKVELGDDFFETWTVIAELQECCEELSTEVAEGFSGTWTAIAEIDIDLSQEFAATWTALAALQECCDELSTEVAEDFAGTWTAIAAINTDFSQAFAGTWTALAALQECCDELSVEVTEGFAGTWTAIAAINTDCSQAFAGTWTALAALQECCEEVSTQVAEGFSGTWTAIAAIDTDCSQEFAATWTALAALQKCCDEVSIQVTDGFVGTWTAVAAIDTDLIEEFAGTWTALAALHDCCCNIIYVRNSDQVGGIITLSTSENYQLVEDIIYPIVITADDLCLNLDCRKISSSTGSDNLITVNSNLSRVSIYNGDIVNTDWPTGSGIGVLINSGCSNINLKNLSATGCGNGIQLAGVDGSEIIGCLIEACDLVSNTTGLVLDRADENIVQNCSAIQNTQAGFELQHSESNCFYDCQALKTSGSQSTMGFVSTSGKTRLLPVIYS